MKQYHLIILLILIVLCSRCDKQEPTQPQINFNEYGFNEETSKSLRVGVYFDYGVFDACKTNTINMLNQMHCTYTAITKDSILNGALTHYRLLIMPGGDMWQYNSGLCLILNA